jgi:hypothetical protein
MQLAPRLLQLYYDQSVVVEMRILDLSVTVAWRLE